MATKRLKRPRDPIQLGKLVVDIATGQLDDAVEDGKQANRAAAGRLGGLQGGRLRAARLSAEARKQIAKKAAETRWKKKRP